MKRWRSPLLAVGDEMPFDYKYALGTVFVCENRGSSRVPIGTGFLIEMSSTTGEHRWQYVVTARHVVEHGRQTWLRLRHQMEPHARPQDLAVPKWEEHPTADVAAAPFDAGDLLNALKLWFISADEFSDRAYERQFRAQPGDTAFFIGLLSDLRSMTDRSIPMVRSGSVGALYQERVPVRQGKTRRIEPCAHLIDVHSRQGFSGGPCIVENLRVERGRNQVSAIHALLGVVVGHFDSYADVLSKHSEEESYETDLRVQDNQGIAIVVPIEAVRDLLDMEVFVKDRAEREAKSNDDRDRDEWENAATLDAVQDPSEFERFKDLTRKLVNVPKKEVDEKRRDES